MFKSPFLLDGIEVGLDGMEKDGVKRAPCVCEVSGWDDTKLPSCLVWLRIGRDGREVKQRERGREKIMMFLENTNHGVFLLACI